jgi:hypothetical protein
VFKPDDFAVPPVYPKLKLTGPFILMTFSTVLIPRGPVFRNDDLT